LKEKKSLLCEAKNLFNWAQKDEQILMNLIYSVSVLSHLSFGQQTLV